MRDFTPVSLVAVSRVAAIAESQPGYEVELVYAVMAPAGTPRDIITRRNAELGRARNAVDTRERLVGQGFEVRSSTPEQLGDYIASEITKWEPIAKESGAKPE